jgi:hypothetical protein
MKRLFIILVASIVLLTSTIAFAESEKGENIVADVLVVRPVGLAAIVAGTALFLVSLPVAVFTKDVSTTAKQLVLNPFDYTFDRPLGDFNYQTDPIIEDSPAKE